jgi:predicted phage terminase large subunit-like protein
VIIGGQSTRDTSPVYTYAEVEASLLRDSLPDFYRAAWEYVDNSPCEWNWHLDELCDALSTAVIRREQGYTVPPIVITIPPGCSKSMLLVMLNAWVWTRGVSGATQKFFTSSYDEDLTKRDVQRVRQIVSSSWYRETFGVFPSDGRPDTSTGRTIDPEWNKRKIVNNRGGERIATSTGGRGTGHHPDFIILDDLLKAQDARSDAKRLAANDYLDSTISTRKARNPIVILIAQVLHEDDPPGHMLAKGGCTGICFPMRFEPDTADPRDHRTEPGELLWPTIWPEDKVRAAEIQLGPLGTSSQLQQRATPPGGGLFRYEYFEGQIVDALPVKSRLKIGRGWDTANTKDRQLNTTNEKGDWTCGVKMAEDIVTGNCYVMDVLWCKTDEVDSVIGLTAELDGKECAVREERVGGDGKVITKNRSRKLRGYDYAEVPISDDKVTRAMPYRAQCEMRNVFLLRGEWNKRYIDELCGFPFAKHDDAVDGSSCIYNSLGEIKRFDRGALLGSGR